MCHVTSLKKQFAYLSRYTIIQTLKLNICYNSYFGNILFVVSFSQFHRLFFDSLSLFRHPSGYACSIPRHFHHNIPATLKYLLMLKSEVSTGRVSGILQSCPGLIRQHSLPNLQILFILSIKAFSLLLNAQ